MNSLIITALSGIIMMFSGILLQQRSSVRVLALLLQVLVVVSAVLELRGIVFFHIDSKGMMGFDRFALLFILVINLCNLAFFALSAKDMERVGKNYADYFALIFFIMCGVCLAVSFNSLLMLFLGIEIISIPLYILTGSEKRNLKSNEASLKYFLMGSFSTGLMLMGIALVYGATGSFYTNAISTIPSTSVLLIAGMMMLLFSMTFKVSAAPFHFWTPDVYDGSPTVFTSFMATIVKASFFIAFMRLFGDAFGNIQTEWKILVAVIVALTLFIGNITAVFQQSVKRMLAYSSISQAGFMMMAVYALNTSDAHEGIILYAAAYSLATIGIFSVLVKMQDQSFTGFNGFAKQHPVIAAVLVIFLLSLAGIPLTAGFLSKFYMLRGSLAVGSMWLPIFAVLMAAISVYYYFRLIEAMYFKEGPAVSAEFSTGFRITLISLAVVTILLGLFPGLLTTWIYF
jgi:NADH-quinone oxidoreductase subunit N